MAKDTTAMPFWNHVEELRKRLLISIIALAITTLISFFFTENLIYFLSQPIGSLKNLQSIEITENVAVFMRVALLSGVILSMPVLLYEVLAFVVPALKPSEKKWIYFAVGMGTLLFVLGVAFAYFVMLPNSIKFLINFLGVETRPRLSNYMHFITNLLFWMGVGFQAPLIIFALAKMKVVSAKTLAKQWRYGLIAIAILAAVITPTIDPVNMGLLMIPLFLLYLISVLFAYLATK